MLDLQVGVRSIKLAPISTCKLLPLTSQFIPLTSCLISCPQSEEEDHREILHFHYTKWPDFGVPQNPEVFLEFLYAVRSSGVLDGDKGPSVVHCSAGIGRSGTFCIVDTLLAKVSGLVCKGLASGVMIPSIFSGMCPQPSVD